MPVKTANPNPVVTRNNEATMSSTNRPVRISSTKPRATSIGDGKTDAGNTPDNESAVHTNNAQSKTTNGRMRSLAETGLSFTIDSEAG